MWSYAALAWFTFRVIVQNLKFTGLAGWISLMVHVPLMWLLVNTHTTADVHVNFEPTSMSNYLLATANAVGYTHVAYDLFFVSNWYRGLIQVPYVLVCLILCPIWHAQSWTEGWTTFCYDWFTLTCLFGLHVLLCSLWAATMNSPSILRWRDEFIVRVMNATLQYLVSGRVSLRSLNEQKRREDKQRKIGATIVVRKPLAFLEALFNFGELGLGESFVRGEWEEGSAGALFDILCGLSHLNNSKLHLLRYMNPAFYFRRSGFHSQFGALDRIQSANSIASHYDDGNELFRTFLGEDMVYTSATWEGVDDSMSLEEAQRAKVARILDLARDKTNPTARLRLMDIGSGWGYLVSAAKARGDDAMGLCNCESMFSLATERYGPLFVKMDYRDITATHTFDAITCVEMIEAVPARDYKAFVASCSRALRPGGRVVMQVSMPMPSTMRWRPKLSPIRWGVLSPRTSFLANKFPTWSFCIRHF
jgi:ubiquinone/menaquinone biosynthesis C-methylase UbiE